MCDAETCSTCDFDTRHPSDIVRPLCTPYANVTFVIYRLLVAVYFTVFLVVHLSTDIIGVDGLKVFLYLSDWTLILTTLYAIVAFLNAVADYAYYQRHGLFISRELDEPPILYRLQWFLYNVCLIASLLILASFWPTVGAYLPYYKLAKNINLHAMPAIVCFVDLCVTAVPIRYLHVIYPIAYGGIYLVFAAIYWAAGGTDAYGRTYIYGILDFDHPKVVGLVVVVETIGAVVFQWIMCGITWLRNKLARDCGCAGRVDLPEELPLTEMTVAMLYA